MHDVRLDRSGYARNSTGGYVKGGTSFEFSRLLTGEIGVGYAARDYVDPRLNRLEGLLVSSLADLDRDAADDGKILFRHRDLRDHAARHLGRADAHLHRRSRSRFPPLADRRSASSPGARSTTRATAATTRSTRCPGDLIYKMNRNIWLKGTLRRDWLDSNLPGNSTASTVVMLGVRLQN